MKKIFRILFMLIILAALLVPAMPTYAAATLSVPGTYSTITAAVAAAGDGDTIEITGGTYTEDVSISQKGLTIIGLAGTNGQYPLLDGTLTITDTTSTTNIKNMDFKISAAQKYSLVLKKVNGININNCKFNGGGYFLQGLNAVQLEQTRSSNVTIDGCTFKNGYYLAVNGYVNGLTVINSTIENCKSGINAQGAQNVVVTNTDISVVAQANTSDTYCIRFATSGAAGSGENLNITGGTFLVDKNGLTPDSGIYHSAIIIRSGAIGDINVSGAFILGQVVNLSPTIFIAHNNWWGHTTGPLDDSDDTSTGGWYNPAGLGSIVSDRVDYTGWQTADPIPAVPEFPAYLLFALGLTGLGGFIFIKKRKIMSLR